VVLGHEIAAEVVDDPAGEWPVGTRVAVYPPRGCGACIWCARDEPRFCLDPPEKRQGGYAEYAVYPSGSLLPVPGGLEQRSVALADPLGVATRAIEIADPRSGDVAYVGGLGPIGLMTVSVLAAAGCIVVGGDPLPERRVMGERLGCVEAIDPTRDDPFDAANALDPYGPRLAFECSGHPEGLQQIFDACAPLGTVGILGIPKMPTLLLRMTVREQRAFSISGPTRSSMRAALQHLVDHPQAASIITGTIPLEELGSTIEMLRHGEGGIKVLVEPGR
jgi:L-idonate 5-dehydrogenase